MTVGMENAIIFLRCITYRALSAYRKDVRRNG
jgi:hypothetical protein